MRTQDFARAFLFVAFFTIGATVLAGTVLCDDLLEYYNNRHLLSVMQDSLDKLESLNADYDVLLEQLEQDPNFVRRIAPATLGAEPNEPNTAYPPVTPETLAAAKQTLTAQAGHSEPDAPMPAWLNGCCQPRRRGVLFACGAFLVLISFIFFGPAKPASP